MTEVTNREFRLKHRPKGRVTMSDFDFVSTPLPPLGPGEALIRTLYLSIDPTNRVWMSERDQYMPPVALGEVMRGGGIGRVVASNSEHWQVGDLVSGLIGWQEYYLVAKDSFAPMGKLPANLPVPLPVMMGACGMTGATAYFGLLDLGQPKPGETVVVSAAAGAVGSVVGQIARIKGCRAVGIAGGTEKCRWLTEELGFAAAVDYKKLGWEAELVKATPGGIDVDFENVGGEIMTAVINRMNLGGRVALCGMISGYNNDGAMLGDFAPVLMKRLTIRGFIVSDYLPRWPDATTELIKWYMKGELKSRETIIHGFEHTPDAVNRLFDGNNIGKLLVKVAEE